MDFSNSHLKSTRCKSQKINYLKKSFRPSSLLFTIKKNKAKLDTTLELKKKQLQEQITRTKLANINFLTHIKLKKIIDHQEEKRRKNLRLYNQSAIKIQKCFRGYLVRKKLSQLGISIEKLKFKTMIAKLEQSVNSFFMNSKSTLKAVIKIQRAYREYKKRKQYKCWVMLQWKVKKMKTSKRKIRNFIRERVKYKKSKEMIEKLKLKSQLKAIRRRIAFSTITSFWKKNNLNFLKIIENIRSHNAKIIIENEAKSVDRDSPSMLRNNSRQEKDGHANFESFESKKSIKKGKHQKNKIKKSVRSKNIVLPAITIPHNSVTLSRGSVLQTPLFKKSQSKFIVGVFPNHAF
ncbi:hypothetical protein SteCoe_6378 [Stentor coeruleus]|uniref:Uncharacterized protein n=1 Tax=Stentor coeruleus TaxID=5963 RepID=A0A1R2CQ30_9CILI|nr:hypothetical protein SteCoe_6378 [Stentor coeruleus]